MKIFLINPACLDLRVTDNDAIAVPIGLYYIGSTLIELGFQTTVINLAAEKNPVASLLEIAESAKPDVAGFSLLSANRHSAIECADALKKILPDIKIVFGGVAPTFEPHHFFRSCNALDFIVKGEGEISFAELLSLLKTGKKGEAFYEEISSIKGLFYRNNGQITETENRAPIENLDLLTHPSKYFNYSHLALSRGCPGKCRFCGSPDFWGRGKVRFHSAAWFVDEIELLSRRGITQLFISDDTFTMKKEIVIEVCRLIVARNIKITWQAISRVDFIDEEILFHMRKAGCIQISFGVESGSDAIRRSLGKSFSNEIIEDAFRMTASFGILPRAYFIYGSPGENEKSIKESVKLIKRIAPLSMISYMLVVFPGTAMYRELKSSKKVIKYKKNINLDTLWNEKVEDIPWFEFDDNLDFRTASRYGEKLRDAFFSGISSFALNVKLVDNRELYREHADFLSRLAMTFSHGDYAGNPKVKNQEETARELFIRSLSYAPDPRAYLGLAMMLQKKRDFTGAIEIVKEAFEKLYSIYQNHSDQDNFIGNNTESASGQDNDMKRRLSLCMAISLMNQAQFREAVKYLEPFGSHEEIQPYLRACLTKI